MKFLKPEMFWHLVWILPVMLAVFISAWYRRKKVLSVLTGRNKPDNISVFYSPGMRIFRFILLILTIIFLITALARPVWDYQTIDMRGSGRDLLVVFDTSKSMLSRDVQPSRLDHAKWFIRELVKQNPGDRFGLVSFAGEAFLECPLTVDKTSFLQHVSELDTSTIPVGGTNIEKALNAALKSFESAEAIHRAVILVTDGDELTGNSNAVVKELIKKKIPLFIVGLGDPSQPPIIQYKDTDGSLKILKDSAGNTVNSPLNEKSLIELARETGGIYVRSTAADTGLKAIENRIKRLNAAEYAETQIQKPVERFAYPLWAALIILLVWMCLSERGKGKKALSILLLANLIFSVQAQSAMPNETAVELFNRGVQIQTGETVPAQKPGEKAIDPLSAAEDFYLRSIAAGPDKNLAGKIYQNLGAIFHQKGQNNLQKAATFQKENKIQDAIKELDKTLEQLKIAEKYYQESMVSSENLRGIVRNQTKLLQQRKNTLKLKKDLEDFLKKQQKAQKQIQKAKDNLNKDQQNQKDQKDKQTQDQNKQDQNKQDQKDQKDKQSQDQKDQKDQKDKQSQDQNKLDQSKQNSSAQEAISQAKKATDEMKQSAKDLGLNNKEKQADAAKKELDKAEQELNKNNPEKAEKHLDNAAGILETPKQSGDQKDQQNQKDKQGQDQKDQQNRKDKQGQDQKDQQNQQNVLPQPAPGQQQGKQGNKEDEIDRNQAESILGQMGDDEKALRDAIKAYRLKNSKLPPVTKDW